MNKYFPIGNCYNGLDIENIIDIETKFYEQVIKINKCHICSAQHFCPVCYAVCCKDGYFSDKECQTIQNNVIKRLSTIYSIKEKNKNAFIRKDITPIIEL
jgi:hypothetical protein